MLRTPARTVALGAGLRFPASSCLRSALRGEIVDLAGTDVEHDLTALGVGVGDRNRCRIALVDGSSGQIAQENCLAGH